MNRNRFVLCLSAAGALLSPIGLVAAPRAALGDEPSATPPPAPRPDHPATRMVDPRFREGRAADILVKGAAPLLRGTVDAFVDFLEAWHDITLAAAEEQTIRDAIETSWPTMTDEDRQWFSRQGAARDRMRPAPGTTAAAADPETAKGYLDAFGREFDARVAASPNGPWATVVRKALERKSTPFSMSPMPAVSVAALDAFEEMVQFLVTLARNDATPPTEGQRIAVRPSVRRAMDASGVVVHGRYARMPRLWSLVKATWDRSDDAGRLRFRWSVVKLFRRIAKLPLPQGTLVLDLPGYAQMANEVSIAINAPDAYTSAFSNLGETITAVVLGLGLDAKDLEPAFNHERLGMR
jgi:hypothetical protein